jgi:hypothetical protein
LVNSSITIGGTAIALGASSNALANDITIYGVTVGRGGGAGATNATLGLSALANGSNTGVDQVAIGRLSLTGNTSGSYNVSLGSQALYTNQSGSSNVAIGYTAAYTNLSGSNNVAIGHEALNKNSTASNNVAVGHQAGYLNQTATGQTFLGFQAGYSSVGISTTIGYNTALGFQSGANLSSGYANTFIGSSSGNAITSGYKHSILGQYSGNQGGLDIRTANNVIVLSDGDGNPVMFMKTGQTVALEGANSVTGTGINFPATQNASSNANTLDDYEEGTWTPTLLGSGTSPTVTYTQQSGSYVKIGKNVTVTCDVRWSALSGGSGVLTLGGLPFAASTQYSSCVVTSKSGANTSTSGYLLGLETLSSNVLLTGLEVGQGNTAGYSLSSLSSSGYIIFSLTYISLT